MSNDSSIGVKSVLVHFQQDISVGRRSHNDIVIDHPSISREHLQLSWKNGFLVARDVGSRNGTLLNKHHMIGEKRLELGDCLDLGVARILLLHPNDPDLACLSHARPQRIHEQLRTLPNGLVGPLADAVSTQIRPRVDQKQSVDDTSRSDFLLKFALTTVSFLFACLLTVGLFYSWLGRVFPPK